MFSSPIPRPFLVLVDQQPAALQRDAVERDFELRAAVAPQAVEHVARETLGVDADQRGPALGQAAHFEHDRLFDQSVLMALESVDPEESVLRGKICFGHLLQP